AARTVFDRSHPLVIILDEGTPLYSGNGPNYSQHEEMPTLPAGLEARLLYRRGRWLQIELSSGDVGWVPVDAVLAASGSQSRKHKPTPLGCGWPADSDSHP